MLAPQEVHYYMWAWHMGYCNVVGLQFGGFTQPEVAHVVIYIISKQTAITLNNVCLLHP